MVIKIEELLCEKWRKIIGEDIIERTQEKIDRISGNDDNDIFPARKQDIFRIFNECDIQDIRVVIVGQDVYHNNEKQANGIAFSVNEGVTTPPSLNNIFKELKREYGEHIKTKNDLIQWVKQGVFLMNASLTVEKKKPGSHMDIWEEFTNKVIQEIDKRTERCGGEGCVVFCLWGKFAEKKECLIKNDRNYILKCSHPSPFSAYKTDNPFIGSDIFKKINIILKQEIEWTK
jgi:uracil-DNA glycosylase